MAVLVAAMVVVMVAKGDQGNTSLTGGARGTRGFDATEPVAAGAAVVAMAVVVVAVTVVAAALLGEAQPPCRAIRRRRCTDLHLRCRVVLVIAPRIVIVLGIVLRIVRGTAPGKVLRRIALDGETAPLPESAPPRWIGPPTPSI